MYSSVDDQMKPLEFQRAQACRCDILMFLLCMFWDIKRRKLQPQIGSLIAFMMLITPTSRTPDFEA